MIPEIGVFSLVLALLIAVLQGSLPLAGFVTSIDSTSAGTKLPSM